MDSSATDLLQEHLDKQAIIDITIRYTWLLDHGPREDLDTVFTADAQAMLGRACDGANEIIARVKEALDPLHISQHIVSNHQVTVSGDTGTSRCYFHAQHVPTKENGGSDKQFIVAGRYVDELVRTADGWRINHRVLHVDWTA